MALQKYLWTSRTLGPTATVADHINKYCWNAPGNWRIWGSTSGVWQPTTTYPGYNPSDTYEVYVGCENHPTYGKHVGGWTFAKHPLLFGGCSHADGIGWTLNPDWGYTFASRASVLKFAHIVGVTNTSGGSAAKDHYPFSIGNPYKQLEVVTDYPFPYLGGGISGEIAEWCATRDGLNVGSYIQANYEGRFDPTKKLKLAINQTLEINDQRIAGLKGNTATQNPFEANIDLVERYVPSGLSAADANPRGYIILIGNIFTPNGSGVVLNGGAFKQLYVNAMYPVTDLPAGTVADPGERCKYRELPYSDVVDAGVVLNNITCDIAEISNLSAVKFYRGNYNTINMSSVARLRYVYPSVFFSPFTFRDAFRWNGIPLTEFVGAGAPIVCANNWDYSQVLWRTRGISASTLEVTDPTSANFGTLYAKRNQGIAPWRVEPEDQEEIAYGDSTSNVLYEGNLNTTPDVGNPTRIPLPPFPTGYSAVDLLNQRHDIILGDPDDQTFVFGSSGGYQNVNLYKVKISNADQAVAATRQYVPWVLKFASPGSISNLELVGGRVGCTDGLSSSSTVRIYQAKLWKHSVIDIPLGKDVRFGGMDYLAGGNMARWWGGIMGMDISNNKVRGQGQVFWNFANPDDGYRSTRQPNAGEIVITDDTIPINNSV